MPANHENLVVVVVELHLQRDALARRVLEELLEHAAIDDVPALAVVLRLEDRALPAALPVVVHVKPRHAGLVVFHDLAYEELVGPKHRANGAADSALLKRPFLPQHPVLAGVPSAMKIRAGQRVFAVDLRLIAEHVADSLPRGLVRGGVGLLLLHGIRHLAQFVKGRPDLVHPRLDGLHRGGDLADLHHGRTRAFVVAVVAREVRLGERLVVRHHVVGQRSLEHHQLGK